MIYIWIGLGIVAGIVVLIAILCVVFARIGGTIPEEHTATSVIRIDAPIEQVFEAIADIASHPAWAKGTTRVHVLPDKIGPGGVAMQVARIHQGHNSFVLMRTRCDGPTLLERTIADDRAKFSGTWLYRLSPLTGTLPGRTGCEVKLTETGRVNIPIARAMMKHFFGYHMYTNKHLESLAKKFGTRAKAHRA